MVVAAPRVRAPALGNSAETRFENQTVAMADLIRMSIYQQPPLNTWPSLEQKESDMFGNELKYELVYGEVVLESIRTMFEAARVQDGEVFMDIGSGDGKVVLAAHLLGNFRKVLGIEFVPSRFSRSCSMLQLVHQQTVRTPGDGQSSAFGVDDDELNPTGAAAHAFLRQKQSAVKIVLGDATQLPLNEADVVYMCNTCFGMGLMNALMDKFAGLRQGARILALHDLPVTHPTFKMLKFVKRLDLKVSWTPTTPVFIYEKLTPPVDVQQLATSKADPLAFADVIRPVVRMFPSCTLQPTTSAKAAPGSPPFTFVSTYDSAKYEAELARVNSETAALIKQKEELASAAVSDASSQYTTSGSSDPTEDSSLVDQEAGVEDGETDSLDAVDPVSVNNRRQAPRASKRSRGGASPAAADFDDDVINDDPVPDDLVRTGKQLTTAGDPLDADGPDVVNQGFDPIERLRTRKSGRERKRRADAVSPDDMGTPLYAEDSLLEAGATRYASIALYVLDQSMLSVATCEHPMTVVPRRPLGPEIWRG